jgi:hypothetical protein
LAYGVYHPDTLVAENNTGLDSRHIALEDM